MPFIVRHPLPLIVPYLVYHGDREEHGLPLDRTQFDDLIHLVFKVFL